MVKYKDQNKSNRFHQTNQTRKRSTIAQEHGKTYRLSILWLDQTHWFLLCQSNSRVGQRFRQYSRFFHIQQPTSSQMFSGQEIVFGNRDVPFVMLDLGLKWIKFRSKRHQCSMYGLDARRLSKQSITHGLHPPTGSIVDLVGHLFCGTAVLLDHSCFVVGTRSRG